MKIAYMSFAALLILVFLPLGLGKVLAIAPIRERAGHLGFSVASYRGIGVLEIAAVLGLLGGIAWWPVGVAAGIGSVLLMIGALVAHLRNGDGVREYAPAVVTGLIAAGYVVTRLAVVL